MVEYATLEDFRRFQKDILYEDRASMLRKAHDRSPKAATFLSHSTKDQEYLPGVIRLLENHGASVYTDKKDDELPPFTSRETAKVLRARIEECRKFIMLATTASKDSRWVPWELGVSDGLKRPSNTAILPGLDTKSDTKWTEREYLGIYDRIVWGKLEGESGNVWMVLNQEKNTATELSKWLAA